MENNAPAPVLATPVQGNAPIETLPGETKAEAVQRLYKVTVDGQEREVDEDTLRKGYAHGAAAAKRMEEAALAKKEATNKQQEIARVFNDLKGDTANTLRRLGIDPMAFAEQFINRELEESMMDPRDKELREWRSKEEKRAREEREYLEEQEREQYAQEEAQLTQQVHQDIIGAMQTSGLPENTHTMLRIVHYMRAAIDAGHMVQPHQVVEMVKKEYIRERREIDSRLSDDQYEEYFGSDIIKKLAKKSVASSKKENIVPKSVNKDRARPGDRQFVTPDDYFRLKKR